MSAPSGGVDTNDRHVKFKDAPVPVQIPGSPRADGPGPHSSASTQPPPSPHTPSVTPCVSTPHTPGGAPGTPQTPGTPYTPGGHPIRRASIRGGDVEFDPVKVLRDRALRRMNGNKEEVNNIMTASYATNVQRVKAIIMQSKSGQTRDAATLGTLCEFTCEWFRRQSEDVLMQLSAVLQLETFMNSTVIFRKGDPSDKVFIVLMGGVELVDAAAPLGQQTQVLKRGECIGAQACLEMRPRVTMCMAKGHTELLLVNRKAFLTVFKDKFATAAKPSIDFLREEVPLFQGLSVEETRMLARSVSVEHVPRGKMFQLDQCESLYILREGEARLMVPDPQDAGTQSDSMAVFGKEYSHLTTRERKELRELKLQRLRRCHPIVYITRPTLFGDNFHELFPWGMGNPTANEVLEYSLGLKLVEWQGWFVRTETKCTLFELKKAELPTSLSRHLLEKQRAEAEFRLTYYAGRHKMYFSAKETAKRLKERQAPPPRTVQSYFARAPPELSIRVKNLIGKAEALKERPIQHAKMAPYNKLGSTSVASENAVARYRDNIANLNMRRLTTTLQSLTVPLDPRFNAKTGRWMGGAPRDKEKTHHNINTNTQGRPSTANEAAAWDAAFSYTSSSAAPRPSTAAAAAAATGDDTGANDASASTSMRFISTAPADAEGSGGGFFLTSVGTSDRTRADTRATTLSTSVDAAAADGGGANTSQSWVDPDSTRPAGYRSPPRRNRSGYPDVKLMPPWSLESIYGNTASFTNPFKHTYGDASIPPLRPHTPKPHTPSRSITGFGRQRPQTVHLGNTR